MSDKSEITQKKIFIQFNKIRFINNITDSIASYGVQCGLPTFMDDLDMNCGAVPEGDIEHIIDPASPLEFLSMYTKISCDRFAMTMIQISMLDPVCKKAICNFLKDIGNQNQTDKINSPKEAFDFLDEIILYGNVEDSPETVSETAEEITWKNTASVHKKSWSRFNGDMELFNQLLEIFANAILENTNYKFRKKEGDIFSISA